MVFFFPRLLLNLEFLNSEFCVFYYHRSKNLLELPVTFRRRFFVIIKDEEKRNFVQNVVKGVKPLDGKKKLFLGFFWRFRSLSWVKFNVLILRK